MLGFRTSPYLQSKLAILGCEHVYDDVPDILKSLLGINTSTSQVYRTCLAVSSAIDENDLSSASSELSLCEDKIESVVYGMIDGSMLPTDDGWQETKVGRVFTADREVREEEFSWQMNHSEYVAHRGHYGGFMRKFEKLLPPSSICKKVFITDGAEWIGSSLQSLYPEATHILDFYHACEHLGVIAAYISNSDKWLDLQKRNLLQGKHKEVCESVAKVSKAPKEERRKTIQYLKTNEYRMHYDQYRNNGLMISSGAIESAHRTVLQVRMKRSGQRWSNQGCDKMIKLRVAHKSKKFNIVINLLKNNAA